MDGCRIAIVFSKQFGLIDMQLLLLVILANSLFTKHIACAGLANGPLGCGSVR